MNKEELIKEIDKLESEYKELLNKYFEISKRNEQAIERLKSSLPVCTCGEIVDILEGKNEPNKYI